MKMKNKTLTLELELTTAGVGPPPYTSGSEFEVSLHYPLESVLTVMIRYG